MTLGRKMLLSTMTLMAGLFVLATLAFLGGVREPSKQMGAVVTSATREADQLNAALNQSRRMATMYRAYLNAVVAKGLLEGWPVGDSQALAKLKETAKDLAIYLDRYPPSAAGSGSAAVPSTGPAPSIPGDGTHLSPGKPGVEAPASIDGQQALANLEAVIAVADRPDALLNQPRLLYREIDATDAVMAFLRDQELPDARAKLKLILDDIETEQTHIKLIAEQDEARRKVLVVLASALLVATIVAALAAVLWQYRSVMLPLAHLRRGVHRIAAGQFSNRLEVNGDREFAELAADFNQMTEELETLYRELEQQVEVKSRELVRSERLASVGFLAAGVAHEINNPLSIITGYAELSLRTLKQRGQADDPLQQNATQALQVICDEAFRCKQIIQKLLTLAKPGTGVREPVAVAPVFADVELMVRGLSRFARRKLISKCDEASPLYALTNETELKQVLLNLVVNALEAVADDTGAVTLEATRQGPLVQITVCDNGRGMNAEVLQHVFEPFFTDKVDRADTNVAPGTGLGLSIVHAIVSSHGGKIRAQSDGPGKGSRFIVELPVAETPAQAA